MGKAQDLTNLTNLAEELLKLNPDHRRVKSLSVKAGLQNRADSVGLMAEVLRKLQLAKKTRRPSEKEADL